MYIEWADLGSGKPSRLLLLSVTFLYTGLLLMARNRQNPMKNKTKVISNKAVVFKTLSFGVHFVFYFKESFIYIGITVVKRI